MKSLLPMATFSLPLIHAQNTTMIPTANPSAAISSANSVSSAPTGSPTALQGGSLNATIATDANVTQIDAPFNETTLLVDNNNNVTTEGSSSNETENLFQSQITLSGSTTTAAATTDVITTMAATEGPITTNNTIIEQPSVAVISGTSFFDSNNNGIRDPNLDYAISSIAVSLYTCHVSDINYGTPLQEATTDFSGVYSFEINDMSGAEYYIVVGDIPSWYTFSSSWTGAVDENGNTLYPDADSVIDPDTSRSECFTAEEGTTYDFGMRLNVPDVVAPDDTPGPTATSEPTTMAPVNVPGATSSPDGGIGVIVSPSPTARVAVVAPTMSPDVGDTVVPSSGPSNAPSAVLSEEPSVRPSLVPSSFPSAFPSEDPSPVPSSIPSIVDADSEAPSAATPSGEAVGPETTTGLQMTFSGIDSLENETAWGIDTAAYIADHFSEGYDVSNLTVVVAVKGQSPGRQWRQLQTENTASSSVVVTYDQTTSYSTGDGTTVESVITDPFESSLDRARYQIYLADESEYYAAVIDVSPVTVPDEDGVSTDGGTDGNVDGATTVTPPPTPAPGKDATPIIIGVCVTVGILLFVGGLYLMYTRRDRGDEYYEDPPAGNGNEYNNSGSVGSGRRGGGYDLETGSKSSRNNLALDE